jgi:hypothetical protein
LSSSELNPSSQRWDALRLLPREVEKVVINGFIPILSSTGEECFFVAGIKETYILLTFFRSTGGHPGSIKEATKAEYKPETTPQKAKVCRG